MVFTTPLYQEPAAGRVANRPPISSTTLPVQKFLAANAVEPNPIAVFWAPKTRPFAMV